MRQLLPHPVEHVDPLDLYLADDRPRHADRPWLMANMVASADGATSVEGRSAGLASPADKAVFDALRASCDWVLVASGTATAERYRMPRTTPEVADRRAALGRPPAANLAIVTASGRVDPTMPALAERPAGALTPLVIAGHDADTDALATLDADVVRLPTALPDGSGILAALGDRGADVVLTEGGPLFNGVLHGAGVLDELCLSVAPLLVGGDSVRVIDQGPAVPVPMRLDRLLEEDGMLFTRYVTR